MPSEVQVIACLLLPSGSISLSGIYERSAAVVCDLRHIFAHLGFGSQCRYDRSARRSMANESGMIAKLNRFTARLKTTPSGLKSREKGLAKAGNARVRRGLIQLAWRFLMFQKD